MIHGICITADSRLHHISLDDHEDHTLIALYRAIDCDIVDVVRLQDGIDLWVDDEGAYRSIPNVRLSLTAAGLGTPGALLFGTGIFLGASPDGQTISLTPEQEARILQAAETPDAP